MVWVLLGALANSIAPDLGLSDAQKGLLVAVPLLGGAVLRIVLGVLSDHVGGRRAGLIGLVATVVPLLLGWLWATSFSQLIVVGLLLGVAGASFAVALPLASRWYPPQYQGLAMGIAGAGNSGTALATFFAPRLAAYCGWHNVLGLALLPIAGTLLVFALFAKDSPQQTPPKKLADYASVLGLRDTWWFCFFYSVTFGGFVGLASFLNILFRDQYQVTPIAAGGFATLCVISGSFLRPVGGYLADRFGGIRMLTALYMGIGLAMLGLWLPAAAMAGHVAFVRGDGTVGHGQRVRIPIGAATIRQSDRRHHGHRGSRRRLWRISAAHGAGLAQATDRQFCRRLHAFFPRRFQSRRGRSCTSAALGRRFHRPRRPGPGDHLGGAFRAASDLSLQPADA